MTHEIFIEYLKECHFFSGLPHEALSKLSTHCKRIELLSGDILFSQGDLSDHLYVLSKGELILFLTKPSGETTLIGIINTIETIGELGALSGEPRSLTVEALTNCEVLSIPKEIFQEVCNENPSVLAKMSTLIISRSLKTMQLFQQENKVAFISLIYPLVKSETKKLLKEKFREYLSKHNVIYIFSDMDHDTIIKSIHAAESNNKLLFIFMDSWKNDIFKLCKERLSHLYIVISEKEKTIIDTETKNIINNVKLFLKRKVELILLHPDGLKQIANTNKYLQAAHFSYHYHLRMNNVSDWERLIRFLTGTAFVVVLGGGGTRGLVHIGVIKALVEKGFAIDAIGGTSIGATVAACYAFTQNYAGMAHYMSVLKKSGIQSLQLTSITWPIISLYSSNPATKTLINIFENVHIEDLWIPYFAVSSNISTKKEIIHKSGLLWEAVRSSAAIPGIYPPFVREGELYIDGGILNNLPVDRMRETLGLKQTILASSISLRIKGKEQYNFPPALSLFPAILSRLGIAYRDYVYPSLYELFFESLLLGSWTNEEKHCHMADILVQPDLSGYQSLKLTPNQSNDLQEIGYRETKIAIEKYLLTHPDHKIQIQK